MGIRARCAAGRGCFFQGRTELRSSVPREPSENSRALFMTGLQISTRACLALRVTERNVRPVRCGDGVDAACGIAGGSCVHSSIFFLYELLHTTCLQWFIVHGASNTSLAASIPTFATVETTQPIQPRYVWRLQPTTGGFPGGRHEQRRRPPPRKRYEQLCVAPVACPIPYAPNCLCICLKEPLT